MSILNSVVTQFGLVAVAATSSIGAIYAVIASRDQRNAEVTKTDKETEQLGDQTWIKRLEALDRSFSQLQELSDARFQRLVRIETLITEHVDWDFKVLRKLRELGVTDIEPPPNLAYIRDQARQARRKPFKDNGNE